MKEMFHKFSARVSSAAGSSYTFSIAMLIVILWAVTGPFFGYSNTWQLVINTGTTVVTFLMVFLVQNTQNRDSKAMQLKLDELIRASKSARDAFVGLEDLNDDELAALDQDFKKLHDAQSASPVMNKLHKKIADEHARRKGGNFASHAAGQAVDSIFGNRKA